MNASDYLRTYTAQELEKYAQQQLQELKKLGHFTIPVDIEAIIEKLDIELDVRRGLKENYHIWGMVAVDLDTNGIVILVDDILLDSDRHRNLYRMTVAEEFAHSLLHKDAIKRVRTVDDFKTFQNHPSWHTHDRNAKRLAAAILMPSDSVLEDGRVLYRQMVTLAGYENPQAIKKYITNDLAKKYEVSVQAMKIRLNEWPVKVIERIDQAIASGLDFLD